MKYVPDDIIRLEPLSPALAGMGAGPFLYASRGVTGERIAVFRRCYRPAQSLRHRWPADHCVRASGNRANAALRSLNPRHEGVRDAHGFGRPDLARLHRRRTLLPWARHGGSASVPDRPRRLVSRPQFRPHRAAEPRCSFPPRESSDFRISALVASAPQHGPQCDEIWRHRFDACERTSISVNYERTHLSGDHYCCRASDAARRIT